MFQKHESPPRVRDVQRRGDGDVMKPFGAHVQRCFFERVFCPREGDAFGVRQAKERELFSCSNFYRMFLVMREKPMRMEISEAFNVDG